MPRTGRDSARQGEERRADILDAARRVCARKGQAATMADIAEAAGVSQGLAYRYFEGKEAIYRELIAQAVEQADAASTLPAADPGAPAGQQLALMVARMLEYRRDHLELFQLLDQVLGDEQPGDFAAQIRERGEHFMRELRRLIVAGQAAGEVAAGDPDQLLIAIVASVDGLTRFGLRQPDEFRKHCPDASILLRMLMPESRSQETEARRQRP